MWRVIALEIIFKGDSEWATVQEPETGESLSVTLTNLLPSTKYEAKAVSVHKGEESESQSYFFTTAGGRKFRIEKFFT